MKRGRRKPPLRALGKYDSDVRLDSDIFSNSTPAIKKQEIGDADPLHQVSASCFSTASSSEKDTQHRDPGDLPPCAAIGITAITIMVSIAWS